MTRRNLYRLAIVVCLIDMGIIAKAIHAHDTWFADASMVFCVAIGMFATQRLVRERVKNGVQA